MIRRIALIVPLLITFVLVTTTPALATSRFCVTLKAVPTTPSDDLSPSPAVITYYTHLASWASQVSTEAPTPSLRTDYTRIARAAASASSSLYAARHATGFTAGLKKAYDLVRAGADVTIISAQLLLIHRSVAAICPTN
jgi:hypothetical protein